MYSIKYIPIVEVIRKAGIITIKNKRIFIIKIYQQIIQLIISRSSEIKEMGKYLGYIDVLQSLSSIAYTENWSRPIISANKKIFKIKNGWHPLIKATLKAADGRSQTLYDKIKTIDKHQIITEKIESGKGNNVFFSKFFSNGFRMFQE